MRTFLVTGGAGFIGSHIAAALVRRGDRVRVLDNLSTGNLANLKEVGGQPEFFEADLLDTEILREALQGVDCVFHQAALASVPRSIKKPLDTHAACATGTINLLNESRKAEVRRVIYAASSSAYGDQINSAKRETDLPAPLSPYAAAKLAAEYYAQAFFHAYGLETVAIRYFNVFGPRQNPLGEAGVVSIFTGQMLKGVQPIIFGDGNKTRDYIYIEDIVQANLNVLEDIGNNQTFNLGSGKETSDFEIFSSVRDHVGVNIEPNFANIRKGEARRVCLNIEKANKILKWSPQRSLNKGVLEVVKSFKK